jgi:hypothetical protein
LTTHELGSSNSTEEENDGNSSEGNNGTADNSGIVVIWEEHSAVSRLLYSLEKDCPARHGSSTDEIEVVQ